MFRNLFEQCIANLLFSCCEDDLNNAVLNRFIRLKIAGDDPTNHSSYKLGVSRRQVGHQPRFRVYFFEYVFLLTASIFEHLLLLLGKSGCFTSDLLLDSFTTLAAFDSWAALAPPTASLCTELGVPFMATHASDDELCLIILIVNDLDMTVVLLNNLTDGLEDLHTVVADTDLLVRQFPELSLAPGADRFGCCLCVSFSHLWNRNLFE